MNRNCEREQIDLNLTGLTLLLILCRLQTKPFVSDTEWCHRLYYFKCRLGNNKIAPIKQTLTILYNITMLNSAVTNRQIKR